MSIITRREFLKWLGATAIGVVIGGTAVYYLFTTKRPPEITKTTIRVGLPISLSGAYSFEGTWYFKGIYRAIIDWVNAKGGVYVKQYDKRLPMELIYYDDKSDKETALKIVEKLVVEDHIDVAIDSYGSTLTYAETPIFEKYKIFNLNGEGMSESIHLRGLKYVVQTIESTYVYLYPCTEAAYELGCRRIAIIAADAEWPRYSMASLKRKASELGMEIVYERYYPSGTKDFTPYLIAAAEKKPDAIFGGAYFSDAVTIRKQIAELGIKIKFLNLLSGPLMNQYYETLGELANGVSSPTTWEWAESKYYDQKGLINWGPKLSEFLEIAKKDGVDMEYYDPRYIGGWQVVLILHKIIETAGTLDPDALREAANKISGKITTIYGTFEIDPATGMHKGTPNCLQWQKGRRVVIAPKEFREAPPIPLS
jgi:branched-chain amino acid transport system substrate-binding protein